MLIQCYWDLTIIFIIITSNYYYYCHVYDRYNIVTIILATSHYYYTNPCSLILNLPPKQ